MATSPSNTTLYDWLSSQGKDASYGARSKYYADAGLDKTLGTYAGTANQNMKLWNHLRAQSDRAAPIDAPVQGPVQTQGPTTEQQQNNEWGAVGRAAAAAPSAARTAMELYNAPRNALIGLAQWGGERLSSGIAQAGDWLFGPSHFPGTPVDTTPFSETYGGSRLPAFGSRQEPAPQPTQPDQFQAQAEAAYTQGAPAQTSAPAPTQPSAPAQTAQEAPQSTGGFNWDVLSPEDRLKLSQNNPELYAQLGGDPNTAQGQMEADEQSYIEAWADSTEGQLAQRSAEINEWEAKDNYEARRNNLERLAEQKREQVIASFEARGLSGSGMKGEALDDVSEQLAADLMLTDNSYVRTLMRNDIGFQKTVIDGVAEIIKAAEEDNDEANRILEKMGYVYYNGQLHPTLARENAEWGRGMDQARLAVSQANLSLSQMRLARELGSGSPTDYESLQGYLEANPNATLLDAKSWGGMNTGIKESDIEEWYFGRAASMGTDTHEIAFSTIDEMVNSGWTPGFWNVGEAEDIEETMMQYWEENKITDAQGNESVFTSAYRDGKPVSIEVPKAPFLEAVTYAKSNWRSIWGEIEAELEEE